MLYKIIAALVLVLLIGAGAAWQEHRVSAAQDAKATVSSPRQQTPHK